MHLIRFVTYLKNRSTVQLTARVSRLYQLHLYHSFKYFLFRYNPVEAYSKWLDAICWVVAPPQGLSIVVEFSYCFDKPPKSNRLNA